MASILLGQFDDFEHAERAIGDLRAQGVADGDVEKFMLNAPGQHDRYPIGGDENADRGARRGDHGALAGAALGGAAGLAAAAAVPLAAPLVLGAGLAVGAYTGSLAGAVDRLGEGEGAPPPLERPAGVRVGVRLATPGQRAQVLDAFQRHDARSVEEADGQWSAGSWADFDPVTPARWVVPPSR